MRYDPFFARRKRAARADALDRLEFRYPSQPRAPAASPVSLAVKVVDSETRRIIDEALRSRRRHAEAKP